MGVRAGLYLRVSTSNGQTTENQRLALEEYCHRKGWQVAKVYSDDGVSGSKSDRPAMNEMLQDARKARRPFDVICTWKLDRLGRSTIHLLTVLQELQDLGVGFVATTQAIDSTTPAGRMLVGFLAVVSQFERELCVERVKCGLERARANGTKLGRPRKGIDLALMMELRSRGLGVRRIAKRLNVSYGTVYRNLKAVTKTPTANRDICVN